MLEDELFSMSRDEQADLVAYISGRDPELFAKIIEYRDERRAVMGR